MYSWLLSQNTTGKHTNSGKHSSETCCCLFLCSRDKIKGSHKLMRNKFQDFSRTVKDFLQSFQGLILYNVWHCNTLLNSIHGQ